MRKVCRATPFCAAKLFSRRVLFLAETANFADKSPLALLPATRDLMFRSLVYGFALWMACAAAVVAQDTPAPKAPGAKDSKASKTATVPDYNLSQVRTINEQIRAVWNDFELKPSPPATDGEWCRRVYLDIIGRIPSVDEIN